MYLQFAKENDLKKKGHTFHYVSILQIHLLIPYHVRYYDSKCILTFQQFCLLNLYESEFEKGCCIKHV